MFRWPKLPTEAYWLRYWRSRQWFQFLAGLPALTCLGVSVLALLIARRPEPGLVAARYSAAQQAAQTASLAEQEDLCLRRLLVLQPTDIKTRFEYAASLARKNELGRATRIMSLMAPLKKTIGSPVGYAPAHFWLADQMIKSGKPLDTENLVVLERHLVASLVGRDAVAAARLPLAELELRTARWSEAAQHLEVLVNRRPELFLTLAMAYRQNGIESKAITTANRATAYFSARAQDDESDAQSRLQWADALLFLNQPTKALEVLQAGYRRDESDPRFANAIGQVFLWAVAGIKPGTRHPNPDDAADAARPANLPISALNLASRVAMLEQALHYSPNHPGALAALARLSFEETPEADRARQMLEESLATGTAPAAVHLILGTATLMKGGNTNVAINHLDQALRLDPKLAIASNNLADALLRTEPRQLERALVLAENALKALPASPIVRETRGEILLEMGNPQAAVTDLETALRATPRRVSLHTLLARAYTELGNPGLAGRHRELADKLGKESAKSIDRVEPVGRD